MEALAFDVRAAGAVDQPHRDAQAIPDLLDAALDEVPHFQCAGDAVSRHVHVAVLCRAVLRGHVQRREPGESVDQRLGQPVGEIGELLPLAQILEVEHGDVVGVQAACHGRAA